MADSRSRERLAARRARAIARLDAERATITTSWRTLSGVVRERERGALVAAQGLATALKLGGAAAAIWMAGRIRAPRIVRRGAMVLTAARTAGSLFARRQPARGRRWQKA